MTALRDIIAGMIAQDGPMPLDRYMALCLGHPEHGYYMTRDPFGVGGDFTTAPEISQVFGELIGIWCAQFWRELGSPRHFALVELGPGRGTLMADILRVLQKAPACLKASEVHFVETSEVLRAAQQRAVPDATWHASVASLPGLPSIVIANEFFDAIPIRQFVRKGGNGFEVTVGLQGGALALGMVPSPFQIPLAGEGVFEDATLRNAIAEHLGNHLNAVSGAALVIDYGHARSGFGDTVQAMQNHAACKITDTPGDVDITSHVDFESLAKSFARGGSQIAGLLPQGEFLQRMGLQQRTEVLAQSLGAAAGQQLVAATERLAHRDQMGHLFKVMAVTGRLETTPYPYGGT